MQKLYVKYIFFSGILLLSGCMIRNDCKSRISYKDIHINHHLNIDSLLQAPDNSELSKIISSWSSNTYVSDSNKILKRIAYRNQRILEVVEHFYEGRKHYGAIIKPKNYSPDKKYPLLVWANGLDQRNPSVSTNRNYHLDKLALSLEDHFILVPSFRGQALIVGNDCYCSDGFFGNAFDGATDDALYLLSLAEALYDNINPNQISIFGVSRGATVAFLAGIRRPGIDYIIAQSGPYNFLDKRNYIRHNMQYKYQFLSRPLTFSEIREYIISSSPLLFIDALESDLLIIHGREDKICPLYNAENIIEYYNGDNQLESHIVAGGHSINKVDYVCEKILARRG